MSMTATRLRKPKIISRGQVSTGTLLTLETGEQMMMRDYRKLQPAIPVTEPRLTEGLWNRVDAQPTTPHTATLAIPLALRQTVPGGSRSMVDRNGDIVATANSEDEGIAIIQRVNAFEGLVAALQAIRPDTLPVPLRRQARAALKLAGK